MEITAVMMEVLDLFDSRFGSGNFVATYSSDLIEEMLQLR